MAPPTGWGRPEHVYQCWCGRALLPAHPPSHPRQGPHWVLRPSLAQPQLQGLLRPVAAQDPSCPTAWPAPSTSAAPAHTAQTRLLKTTRPRLGSFRSAPPHPTHTSDSSLRGPGPPPAQCHLRILCPTAPPRMAALGLQCPLGAERQRGLSAQGFPGGRVPTGVCTP